MKRWYFYLVMCFGLSLSLWMVQTILSSSMAVQAQDLHLSESTINLTYLPLISRRGWPPSLYGVETGLFPPGNDLQKMQQTGAYFIRRNGVLWSDVEPVQGQRNWIVLANLEKELAEYASRNLQVILIVRRTPDWAQRVPGSTCGPIKPEALSAFASFMHDLVDRLSQPPYSVKYWEIWNEPDGHNTTNDWPFGCWGDDKDPYYGGGYYAEMLKSVYPAIKSSDAEAQVLIGGLMMECPPDNSPSGGCVHGKFFEGILRNEGGNNFDGISFHAYDFYFNNRTYGVPKWGASNTGMSATRAKLEFLQSVAAKYNLSGKYYINSETSLLCWNDTCDAQFETTKAERLASSYAEALVLGLRTHIWYDLYGDWCKSGLLPGGVVVPAYTAYVQSNRELAGATYSKDVSQPGVQGFEFTTPQRRVWVLWSKDGQVHPYNITGTPYTVLDVYGNTLPFAATLYISPSPVYVRWVP